MQHSRARRVLFKCVGCGRMQYQAHIVVGLGFLARFAYRAHRALLAVCCVGAYCWLMGVADQCLSADQVPR